MKYVISFLLVTMSILSVGCSKPVPNCNKQTNRDSYNRANNAAQTAIQTLDSDTKNMKTTTVGN